MNETRIVFFSDIHWRGITRHEEYTEVFTEFFRQLKEEIKPDYILCGGDIFHTKTQNITPEVIDKITWMFKELAAIAPVYSILGNHDGILTNNNREDTISPIIRAMNNPRINLFKKSGNHIIPNTKINLCILSCFDEENWDSVSVDKDLINLAMFHGSVKGCITDSDWVMTHGEVEQSLFERFDFAFLGDIHKQQFLGYRPHSGITQDMKPWIGYPGSFIQQNYGEELKKGYYVWDIRCKNDWDVSFKEIPNRYQYITVAWQGSVSATFEETKRIANNDLLNKKIRISSDQTIFHLQKKEIAEIFQSKCGTTEIVFKAEKELITNSEIKEEAKENSSNLRSQETISDLYDAFIKNDYKGSLGDEQISKAKNHIQLSLEKIKQSEEESNIRDVFWTIKDMEWSNLYRFGEGNKIDFSKMNGITGIFGPNKIGKSSIVGTLMFNLFNTTDRGPVKSAYIINKNKREAFAKTTISVNGTEYSVHRTVTKASKRGGKVDEEKAATKLSLNRVEKDGTEIELISENSETRNDTDKIVRKLIGTSQDFLLTAFSNQGGMNRFIEEGATQRKAILNRFLDLDIFENLHKAANEELQNFKAISKKFQNINWEETKKECESAVEVCNLEIVTLSNSLKEKQIKRENLQSWLHQHGAEKQADLRRRIAESSVKCERIQNKITMHQTELSGHETSCVRLRDTIKVINEQIENIKFDELEEKSLRLDKLSKDYFHLKMDLSTEQQKLAAQVKSIKKLDLVPCGDFFPSCHYIKDSHIDRSSHDSQKKIVEDILSIYETVKKDFEILQQEKIEEQIKSYRRYEKELESTEQKLLFSETLMKGCIDNIASLLQELEIVKTEHENLVGDLNKQEDLASGIEEEKALAVNIRDIENKLQQLYVKLGGYTNKLEQIAKEIQEAAVIVEEQKVYDSITQAFSKNGIPAYVLKNKLPKINAELNNILAGIVSFRIFLETEVGSNSLDIYIEDKDSRRVIELASGMEKMIASLAIRVALISVSSLPKPDIFIIDEGWGVLDPSNIGKALELIQSIKNRFRSIMVISHIDAVKDVADNIITICDNGAESKINF